MLKTKMTKTQIIDETFTFFNKNPTLRGENSETCMYNGGDGKHCAVGRCLSTKYKKMGLDLPNNTSVITDLVDINKVKNLDEMLLPRYIGHNQEFWRNMQTIHDVSMYWNENGFTEEGNISFKVLKEKYNGE